MGGCVAVKILALDIATNTGIAVGSAGGVPTCWSENLGKAPDERRFSNVLRLTSSLIATHEPDFVAVEAAVGGPKTSHYLVGLLACVRGCAANRDIPVEAMHLGSIRKHFLGKAYTTRDFPGLSHAKAKMAIKGEVMKRCALLGWDVPNHDAADAAALWDFACATRARDYQAKPVGGLFK